MLMESALSTTFLLVCFSMACYMTYLQFDYYLQNEDLASISYRKFNSESKDQYPTFTICLLGSSGGIFKESGVFLHSTNLTTSSYQNFLNGLENDTAKFSGINYDDVVINIFDGYVTKLKTEMFKDNVWLTYNLKNGNYPTIPIVVTHQWSHLICYSKKVSYENGVKLKADYLSLNASIFYEMRLSIRVYIHQAGQLLRNAFKPVININPDNVRNKYQNKFQISGVEVLRRREKGKIPCNESLTDEDMYVRNAIMRNAGCVPAFWSRFAMNSTLGYNLPNCTQNQYRKVRHSRAKFLGAFEHLNSLYVHPCKQMNIGVDYTHTSKMALKIKGSEIRFIFYYNAVGYKEIVNNKACTFETLCGQVGGFVGM